MHWMRYRYVFLNTAISLIAFVRNVMFMRTLGIEDLAQVSLMQTLVMLIGFIQIGMLNGAFVAMAAKDDEKDRRVVDLVWTALVFLVVVITVGVAAGLAGLRPLVVAPSTLVIGGIAGAATLGSTFVSNALIAHGDLDRANAIGLGAVLASLALGLIGAPHGLIFALFAVLAQPLLVMVGAVLSTGKLRPSALSFDEPEARNLLRMGAPIFSGTIFLLLSYQLERWAIVFDLGEAALGHFYLVMMYMNFFVLLPASILNLHFPPALRALKAGSVAEFRSHTRRHMRDLFAYLMVAGLLTYFVMPTLLREALPQFSNDAYLVYLVFPAMTLFVLRDTTALVFLATKQTDAFIVGSAVFFASYSIGLALLILSATFSLERLLIARGVAAIASLIVATFLCRKSLARLM